MLRSLFSHLDPAERMSELLFGLIMTLTFTLGAGLVVEEGPDATREMLVGVLGCNVAWGIIDGLLYLFNALYARGAPHRGARLLRKRGVAEARAHVRQHLDEAYAGALSEPTKQAVTDEVVNALARLQPSQVHPTREDMMGAAASFCLVCLTSMPALLPFLVLDDRLLALRLSNLILVALLYLIGWEWAGYINANRQRVGLGMALFGLVLVQLTIALGG